MSCVGGAEPAAGRYAAAGGSSAGSPFGSGCGGRGAGRRRVSRGGTGGIALTTGRTSRVSTEGRKGWRVDAPVQMTIHSKQNSCEQVGSTVRSRMDWRQIVQWSGSSSSRTGASTAAIASSTSIGATLLPSSSADLSLIRFAGGDGEGERMRSRKDKGEKAARTVINLACLLALTLHSPRKSHHKLTSALSWFLTQGKGFSYHTFRGIFLRLHLRVLCSCITFALLNP